MANLVVGDEKAVIGGLSAGVMSLLGQVGINGQLTLREFIYSAVTWAVTHTVVWVVTNSPASIVKDVKTIETIVDPPTNQGA